MPQSNTEKLPKFLIDLLYKLAFLSLLKFQRMILTNENENNIPGDFLKFTHYLEITYPNRSFVDDVFTFQEEANSSKLNEKSTVRYRWFQIREEQ